MGIQAEKGSSLVEVMVALFVLAIGLLGVLAMQSKSMQYNQSAHYYSQAVFLANDMAERIRNNNIRLASMYNDPAADSDESEASDDSEAEEEVSVPDCSAIACSDEQLALWDKAVWKQNIERSLPLGTGKIETVGANGAVPAHVRVTVSFDDSRVETRLPGDEKYAGTQAYTLVVEVPSL
jgi:type IV pilus assembly protein PilV